VIERAEGGGTVCLWGFFAQSSSYRLVPIYVRGQKLLERDKKGNVIGKKLESNL